MRCCTAISNTYAVFSVLSRAYKLKIFFGSSVNERFLNSLKQTELQDLDSFNLIRLIVEFSIICHSRAVINIV
jgi:hypothetical protein